MTKIRRYLLVTDHNDHRSQPDHELDVVSWDNLPKIANAADYDAWVLNCTVLTKRDPPKVFSVEEFDVLFGNRAMQHVLAGGGEIFFIGDFRNSFFLPANVGTGGVAPRRSATVQTRQRVDPLTSIIKIDHDPRPVAFGRTERTFHYDDYNKVVYGYLDKVVSFDYSLKPKVEPGVSGIVKLATTKFGTCLALRVEFGRANLVLLPSMGTTPEAETNYVLEKFLGLRVGAEPPSWADRLEVPGQMELNKALLETRAEIDNLLERLKGQAKQLTEKKRWKRLLFDDGLSLEEIVKESFELLGANVVKRTPEKDDYRLEVPGHNPCVLEVKGTRKDQFLRRDLRQLSEWIDQPMSEELVAVKGAFVGNASREKEPSSRGSMFDANNVEYAKLKQMVLMRSVDLYCVVLLTLLRTLNAAEFWEKFFACSGEFDAAEFWDALPQEFRLIASEKEPSSS
jgi:hypothetical protein